MVAEQWWWVITVGSGRWWLQLNPHWDAWCSQQEMTTGDYGISSDGDGMSKEFQSRIVFRKKWILVFICMGGQSGIGEIRIRIMSLPWRLDVGPNYRCLQPHAQQLLSKMSGLLLEPWTEWWPASATAVAVLQLPQRGHASHAALTSGGAPAVSAPPTPFACFNPCLLHQKSGSGLAGKIWLKLAGLHHKN